METQDIAVADLMGWGAAYNPRTIEDAELRNLAGSLNEFGIVEPIVVNQRTEAQGWLAKSEPCIVGGHQRVRAAHMGEMETMPTVWVDLDEQREKLLNLALNRISGTWDEDKLSSVFASLDSTELAEGLSLELTGFGTTEIDRLIRDAEKGMEIIDLPPSIRDAPTPHGNTMGKGFANSGTDKATFTNLQLGEYAVAIHRNYYDAVREYVESDAHNHESKAAAIEHILEIGLQAEGFEVGPRKVKGEG